MLVEQGSLKYRTQEDHGKCLAKARITLHDQDPCELTILEAAIVYALYG